MAQLLGQWRNLWTGSNITRAGDATKEVRRRVGMAGAVFATVGKVWDSSIVPSKLKSGLFRSLVVSVLLCNAECWPMRKNNIDTVEGFIYRCLRRVTRIERGFLDPLEVFGVAATPHALVREKRLHWTGHCLRMKDDPLRAQMTTALNDDGPRNILIRGDLRVRNISRDNVLALVAGRGWNNLTRARMSN